MDDTDNEHEPLSKLTAMQEIEDAYRACSFGKFHLKLISVAFLGSTAGVLVSNTTSYLLPTAECDLNMDLVQKGFLNAAPFVGMFVTSLIAGFLTDNFGRKLFLKVGFGGMFVFCVIAGMSQTYEVLVTAKFFEGMLFSTSISAHVTFLSEFCHKGIRDRMLLCQASFVALAQIISPAMALAILTQEWTWSTFGGRFVLHAWNFYLLAMSLWSLGAFALYFTLPESPKYLVVKQKYNNARDILLKMYTENTGNPAESYVYKNIWKNIPSQEPEEKNQGFKQQIAVGLQNAKPLFHKPLVVYITMLGLISFFVLAIYNVIRLWFPQLSTVVEHYKIDSDNDMCVMLDTYTSDLKSRSNSSASDVNVCVPNKARTETYINSMVIGLVCLTPYFLSGVLVNKVGKKNLQISAGLIGIGTTLGLRWANSKTTMVALFAVGTAILQLMKSLNQAMAVEFFPTSIRSFALAGTMMTGRLGTLSSNIGFPILLDIGCVVPFFTMSGMLIIVTILSIIMPKKKQLQ